jgi:hypothetical protein
MELLKKYIDEIGQDLILDDFNIKQSQMRLPARKHFWVARLIDAKIKLNTLIKHEKDLRSNLNKKIREGSPVVFSNQHVDTLINNTSEIKQLHTDIEEFKLVIEYLEKVEKIMSSMNFEIKNIIDIMRMEQL